MANQTGRPIAPARKLVAAVMGTLAVFVIVYGLGMSSWPVALFGLAVLILAVLLAIANVPRRGGRATVAGNAEVKAIPPPPVSAAYGRADIEVIVVAPGLGTFDTVLRESRIPVAKWPAVGSTIPITVDVDDTRRVRVTWNDAPLRDEGADPPPPMAQPAWTEPDEHDDDLLGDMGPAPWEGRERDWQFESDEPPPPPQPASRMGYAAGPTTPVVVRDTPAGTIVEGHVVGADDEPPPLPRRAPGAGYASAGPDDRASAGRAASGEHTDQSGAAVTGAAFAGPAGSRAHADDAAFTGAAFTGPAGSDADDAAFTGPAGSRSHADRSGAAFAASPDHPPAGTDPDRTDRDPAGRGPVSSDTADRDPADPPSPGPGTGDASDRPGAPHRSGGASGPSGAASADAGPSGGAAFPSSAAPTSSPAPFSGAPSGRAPGTRPSPRPRGGAGTATVERDAPTATAGMPPVQRTPAAAAAPTAPDPLIDVPLDEPHHAARAQPADPGGDATTIAWARTGATTTTKPATTAPGTPVTATPATTAEPQAGELGNRRPRTDDSGAGRPWTSEPQAGSSRTATQADVPRTTTQHGESRTTTQPGESGSGEPQAWPAEPQSSRPSSRSPWAAPIVAAAAAAGAAVGAAAAKVRRKDTPEPEADTAADSHPTAATGAEASRTSSGRTRFFTQPGAEAAEPDEAAWPATSDGQRPKPAPGDARPAPTSSGPRPAPTASGTRPTPSGTRPTPSGTRPAPTPNSTRPAPTPSSTGPDPTPSGTRPDPTPSVVRSQPVPSSAASAPAPVAPPPVAPAPERPFPTAPPPETATGPAAPRRYDDIDIPLDENPEPPPEATPSAARSVAAGVVAPPADTVPAGPEPHTDAAPEPHTGAAPSAQPPSPAAAQPPSPAAAQPPSPAAAQPPSPAAAQPPSRAAAADRDSVTPHAAAATPLADPRDASPRTPEGASAGKPAATSPWGDFGGRQEPDGHVADVITAYPSARPGPAGAIHGVGITVLVTDLDQSISFYRDVLGFYVIDSGDGSAVLASGDTRLVLRTVRDLTTGGRLIYLNLEVGDVEAVYQELRAKGVRFVNTPRPVNRGDKLELWSATFHDPDNHNIAITQWRAAR